MAIRQRGFPRQSRRRVDWGIGPQNLGTTISATGTQLWSTGTQPSENLTVVRTRGAISYYLRLADISIAGFRGASGIYMMTSAAFAIGVTATLDPLDEANSDMWLWHSFFDVRATTSTLADMGSAAVVR